MIVQERDINVLTALAANFIMTSRQLRKLFFPNDKTGRLTRRRLFKMAEEDFVRKRLMSVVNPHDGTATPVYHLGRKGREFLATYFDDNRYLLKPIEPLQPQHLFHYIAVTDTHLLLNEAVAQQSDARVDVWVNEDDICNSDEPERSNHFRLFTELTKPKKLVCAPDSAFVVDYDGQRAVFYLEQDRDSYFHKRVAAQKSPGYEALLNRKQHRKHFPDTTLEFFFVLFVCPTDKRRDQLRTAFADKNKDKTVQRVYRFLSLQSVTPETLLFEPVLRCCHHDDFVPMVKQTAEPTPATTQPAVPSLALSSGR